MEIQDNANNGIKIFRDKTPSVDCDKKASQQGVEVTDQSDTDARYMLANGGDEQGWLFTGPRTSSQRQDMGSWSQVVPAILRDSDSRIVPMLDKTQAVDTNYTAKDQSSSAGDSAVYVRVATTDGTGTPGLLATCLNHESQEQVFFPVGESQIKVDNITAPNVSTKIYDVDALGVIDPTNVGTTKDIWYVEANKTYNKTTAEFRLDATKKGAVNFENAVYPAITVPATPANYETKLVFDTGTNTWKFYTIAEASAVAFTYARVRWNVTRTRDLSEAQLMTYDSVTDSFSAAVDIVWIDWIKSQQCQFNTCGTDTIFVIRKIITGYTRDGVARDMYYCDSCIKDAGKKITHFNNFSPSLQIENNKLDCYIHSTDLINPAWSDPPVSRVKTQIGGEEFSNLMIVNIPTEWRQASGTNYNWLEVGLIGRGMPFYGVPIRPTHNGDYANNGYDSAEKFNETTIATYSKV